MGVRFSASVQTYSGAHPTSCTMGSGSFLGVERSGCGVDLPLPSSGEVEGRVQIYIYSHSGPSWPVLGQTLPLPLPFYISFYELESVCSTLIRNSFIDKKKQILASLSVIEAPQNETFMLTT